MIRRHRTGLLVALLAFVAGRCLVPMDETDLFFNLRLGEMILQTGRVPRTNVLSFTWPHHPDVNLAWIFQIFLALVHRLGGIPATVVLKTVLVLTTIAVLWRVALRRGAHPAITALVLALAAWAAEPRFVERPHLVTFVGISLTLLALERAEAGRPRALWMLVPAGLIWANANSCLFLAPSLLLLYAAGAWLDGQVPAARRAALVALALLPFIFLTPSGLGAVGYIVNHFRMPSLRPLQEYRTAIWPLDGPFFLLAAALLLILVIPGPRPMRALIPALALALLGSRRIRFVAEFALVAGPAIAAVATQRLQSLRLAPRLTLVHVHPVAAWSVMALLAGLTLTPRMAQSRAGEPWFDLSLERELVPLAAIRFTERHGLRDRMYNDLEVGSYLTWDGWPTYQVFQDPRINGYPAEFHAILRRPDLTRTEWQGLLDRFAVTAALITYPGVNPRAALFDPARWALVHRSREALVFSRRLPARAPLLAAEELPLTFRYSAESGLETLPLEAQPPGGQDGAVSPCEWSRRLGDFFLESGDPSGAWRWYGRALQNDDASGKSCLTAGKRLRLERASGALALRLGDLPKAVEIYRRLPDPESRANLGFALLQLHRSAEALQEFDAVLRLQPDSAEATLGRGLALDRLRRDPEAAAALRRFLDLAPAHLAAPQARARLEALLRRR